MFRKQGIALTRDDLNRITTELPFPLPAEVEVFYLETNGGVPEPDYFVPDDGSEAIWIKRILSISDASAGKTMESAYRHGIEKGYLKKDLIPFAIDHGSNFICMDREGGVHFYAMDAWSDELSVERNKEKADKKLTNSFREFIDHLVEDPDA